MRYAPIQLASPTAIALKRKRYIKSGGDWRCWRQGARIARMMPGARGNGRYGLSALRSDRGYLPALRIRSKSPTSSEPCAHREPAVAYAAGILCQYYPEMSRPTRLSSRLSWTYIMTVEAGEQRESSVSPLDDEEERLLLLLPVHPSRLHHIQPSLSANGGRS